MCGCVLLQLIVNWYVLYDHATYLHGYFERCSAFIAIVHCKLQLLSEYVGGGSLVMWIKNSRPMPLDLLRQYTKEMLDGLQYLHSKSILHGDLRVCVFHLTCPGISITGHF